jgi:hypothetical protein
MLGQFNLLKFFVCLIKQNGLFNPLTREIIQSAQRCLPRIFTRYFIFKGLTAQFLYKSFGVKGLIIYITG